jgi:hypothetical protein
VTETGDPLIDHERIRRAYDERRTEVAARPGTRLVTRAKVRIVRDMLKEAQVGAFTFQSDEHAPFGEGSAPSPLQYFVAAVGL